MSLRTAVKEFVCARYYLMRPWMHPVGSNAPVTEGVVAAENKLYAALLQDMDVDPDAWEANWQLLQAAASKCGARMCPKDRAKKKAKIQRKRRKARKIRKVRPRNKTAARRTRNLFD